MNSDAAYDLKRFWELICEHGLNEKKIGELSKEEVLELLKAAGLCTNLDEVPF